MLESLEPLFYLIMPDNSILSSTNPAIQGLITTLKSSPKRIVFADGEDERVIRAAGLLVQQALVAPILLGNREKVHAIAEKAGVSMRFINVIEPSKAADLALFERRITRVEKFRGRVVANAKEMVCEPLNFAAMMVQYGQADGMVGGNKSMPVSVFRATSNFIKPVSEKASMFGVVVMTAPGLSHMGSTGVLLLADCGVTPEPTVEQLAEFAMESGKMAARLIEKTPKIAFLSHSSYGSMKTPSSQKVAAAAVKAKDLVKRGSLGMKIEGEVQADVALDPQAAELKSSGIEATTSDVLIFPNLDAAHISFKLLQHVGKAQHYGQIIMGLTKPAAQVPLTTSVETLVGTAVLLGVESIKGRELHFDW